MIDFYQGIIVALKENSKFYPMFYLKLKFFNYFKFFNKSWLKIENVCALHQYIQIIGFQSLYGTVFMFHQTVAQKFG